MRNLIRPGVVAFFLSTVVLIGCSSSPAARVKFYEQVSPVKPFPAKVQNIAVLALDPNEENDPTVAGGGEVSMLHIFGLPDTEETEYDVSVPAAHALMSILQDEINRQNLPMTIVDRETLDQQLFEREMSMSELVNPNGVVEPTPLSPVDALITAKCNVTITVNRVAVERLDVQGVLDAATSDGKNLQTADRFGMKRTITVSSSFRLTRTATGDVHDTKTYSETRVDEKMPSVLFPRDIMHTDLEAPAQVVGDVLRVQARKFVARQVGGLVPTSSISVHASGRPACQQGVNYLNSESWSLALAAFEQAIEEDSRDDRALFGAGIALEQMGRLPEALERYERASGLTGSHQYAARVKQVRARIRRGVAIQAVGR